MLYCSVYSFLTLYCCCSSANIPWHFPLFTLSKLLKKSQSLSKFFKGTKLTTFKRPFGFNNARQLRVSFLLVRSKSFSQSIRNKFELSWKRNGKSCFSLTSVENGRRNFFGACNLAVSILKFGEQVPQSVEQSFTKSNFLERTFRIAFVPKKRREFSRQDHGRLI